MNPTETPAAMRLKVEDHVRVQLTASYPNTLPAVVSAEASAIETTAFATAKFQAQYFATVSSYVYAHQARGEKFSETYRIPALTAAEERDRKESFKRNLSGLDDNRTNANQADQPDVQMNEQPNVQVNMQPQVQQNIIAPQNVGNTQVMNQAQGFGNAAATVPAFGMPPMTGANVPAEGVQRFNMPPDVNPSDYRLIVPFIPGQQPQNGQIPTYFQPVFIPANMVDPRFLVPASNQVTGQGLKTQGVPVIMNQGFQTSAGGSASARGSATQQHMAQSMAQSVAQPMNHPMAEPMTQRITQPVFHSFAGNSAPQDHPDAPQFTDEMITQLAHQTAQSQQNSTNSAPARRGVPAQRRRRQIAPKEKISPRTSQGGLPNVPQRGAQRAPRCGPPKVTGDGLQAGGGMDKEKSELLAKWIHLQRKYRQRVEKLLPILNAILTEPDEQQKYVLKGLNSLVILLRYPVSKLMEEKFTESYYFKADKYLSEVMEKYKEYESMNWLTVQNHVNAAKKMQMDMALKGKADVARQATQKASKPGSMVQTQVASQHLQRETSSQVTDPQVSDQPHRQLPSQPQPEPQVSSLVQPRQDHQQTVGAAHGSTMRSLPQPRKKASARTGKRSTTPQELAAPAENTTNNVVPAATRAQETNLAKQPTCNLEKMNAVTEADEAASGTVSNSLNRSADHVETANTIESRAVVKKANSSQIQANILSAASGTICTGGQKPSSQKAIPEAPARTFSSKPVVSQKAQAVVEGHVRAKVADHVQKQIQTAFATPPASVSLKINKPPPAAETTPEKQPPSSVKPGSQSIEKPDPKPNKATEVYVDPIWSDFPTDDITGMPDITSPDPKQASSQEEEAVVQPGDNDQAMEDIDLSVFDNIEEHKFSPSPGVTCEDSLAYITRILDEE